MNKTIYLTTTLPYVNAVPHIGFAMEIVQADALARHKRLMGYDVLFNFGTDEHGQKIYNKAVEQGLDPQAYCDEYAEKFVYLKDGLNLSYNNFIRTTDEHHVKAAQEFWNRCNEKGDIYKKMYKVKYCVGCELEKTDSELVDGKCPWHPDKSLEIREEENYFFRFSRYQDKLLTLYDEINDFVVPKRRLNEIRIFVEGGLKDFSISRLKSKMPWGIEVPNDPDHVMYVWFDALVNYVSAIGWPDDLEKFNKYWPVVQVAGKDNLRQQSSMWQAMLMSAGLEPSKKIFIHGFINADGQKMSKSLGNTVEPLKLVEEYGTDALRYYILRAFNDIEDSDFTIKKFEERYNSELANGLGNLVSRVVKMMDKPFVTNKTYTEVVTDELNSLYDNFKFNDIVEYIYKMVKGANEYMNEKAPWKLDGVEKENVLTNMANKIYDIALLVEPVMPDTSTKVIDALKDPESFNSVLFKRV